MFTGDLDGSPAGGTVRSGLDGAGCEIDLNTEHAQALRSALARYVNTARLGPGTRTRHGTGARLLRAA
ncbi:MAG: histone-like nucleoid-structuring protein Lsr2 [Streptosporangiaceae bacterium]